jgi:3-methyl-2-oxobutanoate hydroxymethyltransferase
MNNHPFTKHKTVSDVQAKKKRGEKISMLTAYDYPTGIIADRAGVDMVLVGDSLANVVLGLESTKDVGMTEMIHHAKAVRRGVSRVVLVADMPFSAYQENPGAALLNARRFMDEAGCDAVKLEWFDQCLEVARTLIQAGIPVMGHVGLTPQRADELGGMKVQGKDASSALAIIDHAKALQHAGCFSIVLECIPKEIAKIITQTLTIPTIGIGAGVHCDGQVLVTHDALGLFEQYKPKFVKRYANLNQLAVEALAQFKDEVEKSTFPDESHSYSMNLDELAKLLKEKLK